ncbi:unnamed protein product [Adineta ricciae]|uniref:FLYWCH-type domain-containing protein n=1 Tax=Adineta ricciae TaxID=249248 RepID=A0A814MUH9_ADIRI|nr:unnamed protein product [Adineta ricciae]CAF1084125.1 unnamed protein product [Adineta ricciae]
MSSTTNNPCGSLSSAETEISFLTSIKGKRLLSLRDYIFKCTKATCGVFVHKNLNDEMLTIIGDHNHVAHPDVLRIRILKPKMKSRILDETTSITKIYEEELAKAGLTELIAAQLFTVVECRMVVKLLKFLEWIFVDLYQGLPVRLKHEAEALGIRFQPSDIVSVFEAALIPVISQELCGTFMGWIIVPTTFPKIMDNFIRNIQMQLDTGATTTKESTRSSAFQKRFDNLKMRLHNDEINAKQLLSGDSMLIGGPMN